MRNATRMFIAGPAAMTTMRFHGGWRQYASLLVPSSISRSARFAERRAPGDSCAALSSASSAGSDACELRPEADIKAAGTIADGERGGEVPELVQEDQEEQPDGDDEPGHATASRSSASTRALRSASRRSSRSRAGVASLQVSAAST